MDKLTFRYAKKGDGALILELIRQLAAYERLEEKVTATPELLEQWLFEKQAAQVLIGEADGEVVGFALFFQNFSTFLGKGGIYLEDLFVKEGFRGRGYGTAFLKKLASIATERGCGRLDWSCLDWNERSIAFYKSFGAVALDDWTVYRLEGDALLAAAK